MNRRYRLYSILLINIILMGACVRLFPPEPSYIKGEITDYQKRFYMVSGISFLPPDPVPTYSPKPWEVIQRFAEGSRTDFYKYRFLGYVPHGPRGYCCFVSLNLYEKTNKVATDIATKGMQEVLARSHRGIESKRLKREELLRGTLDERWMEALQADPDLINKTIKNLQTRDEEKKKLVWARSYSKEKKAVIAERVFKSRLQRKRALHRHLPPDTTGIITSNGKRCLSNGHYQGLPTILAKEYATPISGGVELNYAVYCPIGSDRVFIIYLHTKIPPGETFDPYPIVEPIINSIDWAGH